MHMQSYMRVCDTLCRVGCEGPEKALAISSQHHLRSDYNALVSRTNVASEAQEVIDEPDTALGCCATCLGAESWGVPSVLRRFEDRTNSPRPGDQEKALGKENGGDSMKTVPVRDLQKRVKACIDEAQEGRVVITRRGKPAALLVGVEGKDWETVILETDPTFWKLIQQRRKEPTISFQELKARLNRKR